MGHMQGRIEKTLVGGYGPYPSVKMLIVYLIIRSLNLTNRMRNYWLNPKFKICYTTTLLIIISLYIVYERTK